MSDFITDVEQQYGTYCKIAEEYGFVDLNAKKNGFRCTTKSNEFNAGWISFTGAVAAVRDEQQSIINDLKTQLNNMEACYIGKKKQVEDVSQVLCELKESLKDFQEMDLYDKGYRVAVEYVIADLEKALRGENDQYN